MMQSSLFPSDETSSASFVINMHTPVLSPKPENSLEFHAARILLLLRYAGGRSNKIVGRTKIAKLDFFVRYPTYLYKALGIAHEYLPPESPMIRYKYGPWDDKYYDVFAILSAKQLITIQPSKKGDEFVLSERGLVATTELNVPEFVEVIERCRLVYQKFKGYSGNQIKNYIYTNFPEIVELPLRSEID